LWSRSTSRSSLQQNVVPGFTFPAVGPLGLGSPPYRSDHSISDHRYYDPLRLPNVPLRFVRSSLSSPDTLYRPSLLFVSLLEADSLMGGTLLINAGISLPLDFLLPSLYTRKHLDLPSSQVTPMTACHGLRPRWCPDYSPYRIQNCCLPSSQQRRLSLPVSWKMSNDHNEQDFGAPYTACSLDPSGFGLLLPGLPADFTTDLLARL